MNKIALVVHGGAWEIPDAMVEECRAGIRQPLIEGWGVLQQGGSAMDACERAVIGLEDCPAFDAGVGAHLNRDGQVQLDAVLMDGSNLEAGSVAAVEHLKNPIRTARLILEQSPHLMLVGPGAEQFSVEHGLGLCVQAELIVPRERERWDEWKAGTTTKASDTGTVGAVAIDMYGNLAAATSTGGPFGKFPGRVGDSPIIGSGCYADNASGAVSATGEGEAIMKIVLSKMASDLLASGSEAQTAAETALSHMMQRTSGKGGLILLDRLGHVGAAHTTSRMAVGHRTTDSEDLTILV
jgi:beta-aspartyl-peptidase (threonine type)